MNRLAANDPQKNLELIIRESGLTQSGIAQKIAEKGYTVARATINRWANPQKRNRTFSYNPLIMQALLEVCSENLVSGLKLQDLFSDEHTLGAKLRTKRSVGELLPAVLSRAARDITASKFQEKLSGRYAADIPIDFLSSQTVRAYFDIANADNVKFSVSCTFGTDVGPGRSEEEPATGHGQMIVWDRSAIILIEAEFESLTLISILLTLPNYRGPVDQLEGALTISGAKTRNMPTMSHVVLERVTRQDGNEEPLLQERRLPLPPGDFRKASEPLADMPSA